MANLKIEEKVIIAAKVDVVWSFLLDPERVVQCLPGAAYDGKESDNVFLGHIKVKVGPVTTLFAGKATMSDIDATARTLRITGEGKDKNGAGTAKMVMLGKVTEGAEGAELTIDAEVDIAGKLVTFGRGLIKSVSAQLFKQFSARAQEMLAEGEPAPADAEAPDPDGPQASAAEAAAAPADAAAPTAPTAPTDADAPDSAAAAAPTAEAAPAEASAPPTASADPAPAKAAPAPAPAPTRPAAKPAERTLARKPAQEESLNALSLVFRALASSIADFFRRLFGRKK